MNPTKEEIMKSLVSVYYGDLAFIEELNNFTFGRKVQLHAERKALNNPTNDTKQ